MSDIELCYKAVKLSNIMKFQTIEMPGFQRSYSWGAKDKENLARDFFAHYLSDKEVNDYFGRIIVHSGKRFELDSDKAISVKLSDGQHRIVTVVLSVLACKNILENMIILNDRQKKRRDELLNSDIISDTLNCNVYVVAENRKSEKVVDYLDYLLNRISTLTKDKEKLDIDFKKEVKEINIDKSLDKNQRDEKKKNLEKAKNGNLKKIKDETKLIESNPIYISYFKIKNYILSNEDGENNQVDNFEVFGIIDEFQFMFKNIMVGVEAIYPKGGLTVDEPDLENYAFEMFSRINSQAIPLQDGELFTSYITQLTDENHELQKYLFGEKIDLLEEFGISDEEERAKFIYKMNTSQLDLKMTPKLRQWINLLLAEIKSKQINSTYIDTFLGYLKGMEDLYNGYCENSESDNLPGTLFKLYLSNLNSPIYTVYSSNVYCHIKSNQNLKFDLTGKYRLIAVLILISLMETYRPLDASKVPNPWRDLQKFNDVNSGFKFVVSHFLNNFNSTSNIDRFNEFRSRLESHISLFPFGIGNHRKLGKVLLVIADALKSGNQNFAHNISHFDYEHVFPQKYDGNKLKEKSLLITNPTLYAEYIKFCSANNFENDVQRIGNGALLGSSFNKKLQNSSPIIKSELTNNLKGSNAWWPTHWAYLQNSNGLWVDSLINARSNELSKDIVDWLLKDFSHSDLI